MQINTQSRAKQQRRSGKNGAARAKEKAHRTEEHGGINCSKTQSEIVTEQTSKSIESNERTFICSAHTMNGNWRQKRGENLIHCGIYISFQF